MKRMVWFVLIFGAYLVNQANDTWASIACLKAGGHLQRWTVSTLCLPAGEP